MDVAQTPSQHAAEACSMSEVHDSNVSNDLNFAINANNLEYMDSAEQLASDTLQQVMENCELLGGLQEIMDIDAPIAIEFKEKLNLTENETDMENNDKNADKDSTQKTTINTEKNDTLIATENVCADVVANDASTQSVLVEPEKNLNKQHLVIDSAIKAKPINLNNLCDATQLNMALGDHDYCRLVKALQPTDSVKLCELISDHLNFNQRNWPECVAIEVKIRDMVKQFVNQIKSLDVHNQEAGECKVNTAVDVNDLEFELYVQNILDSVARDAAVKAEKDIDENECQVKTDVDKEILIKTEEVEQVEIVEAIKTEETEAALAENAENLELDTEQIALLDQLARFGENLQTKCKTYNTQVKEVKSNFDDFLQNQFNELRTLINLRAKYSERSIQTELSKKCLRRLKKEQQLNKNLKSEVNSSNSTDSSDTESASGSSTSSSSSSSSLNSASSMVQLTANALDAHHKKEIKVVKKPLKCKSDDKTKEKAEEDVAADNSDVKKKSKGTERATDEVDDEDKEIERLINFDGLLRRPKYIPGSMPAKNCDLAKQKLKLTAKDLILAESCSEMEESDYDDDGEEEKDSNTLQQQVTMTKECNGEEKELEEDEALDKESITEKEFLKRYNDSLKQHFLNDSSSMSEDSVESNDELIKDLRSVSDEENSNKLVDKFLESFDPEQDEDEADSEDESKKNKKNNDKIVESEDDESIDTDEKAVEKRKALKSSLSEFIKLPKSPEAMQTNIVETETDKSDVKKKNVSGTTLDSSTVSSSDCELLNDTNLLNEIKEKKAPKKSLEIMLSEAEKRKKQNKIESSDLISLSSDSSSSSSSDAEGADGESTSTGQQSRVLKPMLRQDQLASETRRAQKSEADRIRRLEKKQTLLAKVLKEQAKKDDQDATASNKTNELILDYNSETKTFIKVHPDIVQHLKSHQIDGIKFMYDSCYGGVDYIKKSSGSGCILAHCMGLGKTLQLIALLHTVISYKELKTTKVLVLCPKSTVMNWADEIIRWLGPLNAKNLKVFTFSDTSDINEKLRVVKDWSTSTHKRAGCLLIGYEAFRSLVFYHSYKNRGNYGTSYMEEIREKVEKYLLKPGADLVVCDEGHIIKNSKSAISLAVSKIITSKRIVLTGTPIQNNLKEYYSMVNFIKPLFLGTEKEFANLYANPIKNGQHKDSSKRDIKVMKQRSFVLHKKLSKFVQRKEAELLKTFLPQKFEYVLFIPMTDVQNNLYEHILEAISRREENRGRGLITDYTCLRKIWTHPKVLEDAWTNAINQKNKKEPLRKLPSTGMHSDDDQPDDIYDSQTGLMSVTNDWWRNLISERDLQTILPSNKLRTMFEILRMCEEKDEKCLIFSAFVAVLNVVEFFFRKISEADPITLRELNIAPTSKLRNKWILGQDYYRLDGKTAKNIRHEMVKRFNAPANRQARVFLISSKAGGQGINLTGANRVIILDTSWNPSNDQQNIFRIFRLGQKKNCYIYRLLAMGTMEEKVYSRSVTKQAMSFRVVDEQQIDRHYNMAELAELYTLTKPNPKDRPMPIFPQDSILASLLLNFPEMVYKYHEHDSLLENKVEQELSEQEKADAWAAYERDMQMNSEMQEPANMEGLKGPYGMPPMRNYFGPLAGLDMQTMLNYGNLTNPAATSPFMQSLLAQYNYPGANQQYLDMLSLYSKYSQSPLTYPELSASMASAGVYPNTLNSNGPAKTALSSTTPGLPNNPLSALGDLTGLYGMAGFKNYPSGMPSKPPTPGPSPSNSMYMPHSSSSAAGTSTTATNMYNDSMMLPPAYSGKATAGLPAAFSSLYNFGNEYSQSHATNALNYANTAAAMHLTPSVSAAAAAPPSSSSSSAVSFPLNTNPTITSNATSANAKTKTSNSNNVQKYNMPLPTLPTTARTIDLTKSAMEFSSSQPPPLVDLTRTGNTTATTVPPKASKELGTAFLNALKQSNATATTTTNTSTATPTTTSIAAKRNNTSKDNVVRSQAMSSISTTSASLSPITKLTNTTTTMNRKMPNTATINATEPSALKKLNSEMLIIPTTSPPGPTSISKQFTDISPSISLTAVRNTPTLTPINSGSNKNLKNLSTPPTLLPLHNANKTVYNKNSNSSSSSINKMPNAKVIVTTAVTRTAVTTTAAKAKSVIANHNITTPVNKQPTITVAKFANMSRQTNNASPSQHNNNNNKSNNGNVKTVNATNKKPFNSVTPPTAASTNQASLKRNNTHSAMNMNSGKPATISTAAQLQKLRTMGANSPSGLSANINATAGAVRNPNSGISIRQVDPNVKQSTGNNGNVYIIETNINDKRVAIGTPTRSGNGTTVTKIAMPTKRKQAVGIETMDNKRQRN